jgi:DinB superfamily
MIMRRSHLCGADTPWRVESRDQRREGTVKVDWGAVLVGQLEFYWAAHLRPRLQGLTDEEYLWEPVGGCWSLRRGQDGTYILDGHWPEPSPPPITTIAWRLIHIGVGCFATRTSAFFGDGSVPDDATMFDPRHAPADLPYTAAQAVTFLDTTYQQWHNAIAMLDEAALSKPLGPKGAQFANHPMAELIAHINREVMHHGGEIGLLRDLYRATNGAQLDNRSAHR